MYNICVINTNIGKIPITSKRKYSLLTRFILQGIQVVVFKEKIDSRGILDGKLAMFDDYIHIALLLLRQNSTFFVLFCKNIWWLQLNVVSLYRRRKKCWALFSKVDCFPYILYGPHRFTSQRKEAFVLYAYRTSNLGRRRYVYGFLCALTTTLRWNNSVHRPSNTPHAALTVKMGRSHARYLS